MSGASEHETWLEAAGLLDALYVSERARFRLANGSEHLDHDMKCYLDGIEAAENALRDTADDLAPATTPIPDQHDHQED